MSLEKEITKAIGAHGLWKRQFCHAVDGAKTGGNAADVAKDNVCAFGQWLHGSSIPAATRASADFAAVRRLHADFHKCAAKVMEHVASGRKAEADALMAGDYARISGDLTAAMLKWRAAGR